MTSCRILCLRCGREFDSPLQFDSEEALLDSDLVGSSVPCDKCGLMTPCNPDNLIFVSDDSAEDEDPTDWEDYTGRPL